ncbi:MAG: GGDEF domain-containing protein [Ruminococcus sp.]|nr:GGDEF domain-containing protein [Ruminococcus sp.]
MKKLVLFPLRYNGETKGYIWVTDFDDENTITIRETLELTTYFIASEIANYQMVKQLEILSSIDLLTGVRNRNAMNNRVIRLTSGEDKYPKALRVVFADLNGLKKVNDQSGHNAGDLMLKSAALALQDAFRGQEIYRAGGDEFMLIISNMDDAKFESAIERIRSYSYTEDTGSFAIGCCNDNGRNDIREDMKEADERMYADKEEYYKRFPERRYR